MRLVGPLRIAARLDRAQCRVRGRRPRARPGRVRPPRGERGPSPARPAPSRPEYPTRAVSEAAGYDSRALTPHHLCSWGSGWRALIWPGEIVHGGSGRGPRNCGNRKTRRPARAGGVGSGHQRGEIRRCR